jgi:hypothetical protein
MGYLNWVKQSLISGFMPVEEMDTENCNTNKEFYLLGYNAVFRRKVLPPSSGSKNNPDCARYMRHTALLLGCELEQS